MKFRSFIRNAAIFWLFASFGLINGVAIHIWSGDRPELNGTMRLACLMWLMTQLMLVFIGILCWLIESHFVTLIRLKQDERDDVVRLPTKPTKVG